MLFSSYIRDNFDHRRRRETAYEFIDRSAWKISALVRQRINEWTKLYRPDEEFMRMFKSKADKQHYSAVFELLVYVLLTRSGFSLTRHPDTKTGKKPDFLATLDCFNAVIECTLAGHSFDSMADKNRKETFEEIVDEIEYFPYWINLDIETISEQSVSKRKLLKFLDSIKQTSEGVPNEALVEMKHLFADNGWEVEISLIRKTKPDIKRSLGYIIGKAKAIDTSKPILTALNDKKAGRYGIEREPYIICLNTSDLFTKENCFAGALFGQYNEMGIDLCNNLQKGFFLAEGKPINTSVSAVVIFRNFDLFTLDSSSVSVWHNPYARNKIPINSLPFNEYVYEINVDSLTKTVIEKKSDLFQILGVDKMEYLNSKNKMGC